MPAPRRPFLRVAARALVGAAALAACVPAVAQAWPSRAVRIVVPAGPGGSSDPLARLVAEELGRALQQNFVVENRPGANGNIGAQSVAKASPDGYTLLFGWTGTLISAVTMYDAKPFHPERDFEPIVLVGSIPNIVLVNPTLPAKTLKELVAHAKASPGKLNFGSTGSGSSWHLSGELLKKTEGVFMVHVPYTAPAPALTDLVSNQLQVAFPGVTAAVPFVRDGRIRALAVMADRRSAALPDVPTTKELGYPKLESATWFGLLAPKGTPPDVVARINGAINASLKTPAVRDKLVSMGYTPLGGGGDDFARLMREEIVKWGEVVRFSGAKVD
jgi:tripartite-type tricarboxylate transporter receptor subunit TctC